MSSDGVAPPVTPGTVLAGKYRVESVIGQGGMGVVVEARHIQLEERVALKFLLPEYARHPDASARFLREARAAVRIKSQHVARVSDVGTLETGSPYMVMEYLEGGDIEQQLLAAGTLPVEDAVDAIIQAAEAIAEAHSLGIVHRDIKPANLFVARHSDGSPLVKVLDFGISKMIDASSQGLTRTATTMGSALYMSPEQLRDARSVDHRADIYALGVSLYEMLSGRQPFTADTFPQLCVLVATGDPTPLAEVRPDLPYDFAQVVEKAFKRDPNDRYQSVAELVLALAPWAPARSQQLVERIARTAGYAPRASMPSLSQTGPGQPAPAAPGSTTDLSAAVTRPPSSSLGLAVGAVAFLGLLVVVGGGLFAWHLHNKGSADPAASSSTLAATPAASSAALADDTASAPAASASDALSASAPAPSSSAPAKTAKKPAAFAQHHAVSKVISQTHNHASPVSPKPKPKPTATATKSADEYR
jgi:serine/threonine-protein kinase